MIDFNQLHKDFADVQDVRSQKIDFPSNLLGTRYNPEKIAPKGWTPIIGRHFAKILKYRWGENHLCLHRHIERCAIPKIQKLESILCQDIEEKLLIRFEPCEKKIVQSVFDSRYPDNTFYFKIKLIYASVWIWNPAHKEAWAKNDISFVDSNVALFSYHPTYDFNPQDEVF